MPLTATICNCPRTTNAERAVGNGMAIKQDQTRGAFVSEAAGAPPARLYRSNSWGKVGGSGLAVYISRDAEYASFNLRK